MRFLKRFLGLCDRGDSESNKVATYTPPIITFYCPVCQRDVTGKQQMIYDRGYDRKMIVCLSCSTCFYGRRDVIVDDPYLVNEEMSSKRVTINGGTYFYMKKESRT